jgi:hypothetical protein
VGFFQLSRLLKSRLYSQRYEQWGQAYVLAAACDGGEGAVLQTMKDWLATLAVVKVHTRLERRRCGLFPAVKITKIPLVQPEI